MLYTFGGEWTGIGSRSDSANWVDNPELSINGEFQSIDPRRVSKAMWEHVNSRGNCVARKYNTPEPTPGPTQPPTENVPPTPTPTSTAVRNLTIFLNLNCSSGFVHSPTYFNLFIPSHPHLIDCDYSTFRQIRFQYRGSDMRKCWSGM